MKVTRSTVEKLERKTIGNKPPEPPDDDPFGINKQTYDELIKRGIATKPADTGKQAREQKAFEIAVAKNGSVAVATEQAIWDLIRKSDHTLSYAEAFEKIHGYKWQFDKTR